MDLALAALIASVAYVYAPLLRIHAARHFGAAVVPSSNPAAPPAFVPRPVELPADIEAFCAAESEPWASDELRATARRLHAEVGDWREVMRQMQEHVA